VRTVLTLLEPQFLGFKHRLSGRFGGRGLVKTLLAIGGFLFWMGIFIGVYRVLCYFQGVEGFGDILARKLLSMVLVTFFAILIYSSILTALSGLYLSKDLALLHAAPVPVEKVFLARWLECTFNSSWMVLVFGLPVFLAYGLVYHAGLIFYAVVALSLPPLCLVASALGTLIVLFGVICLPASRMRDVFVILSIVLVVLLYLVIRFMRPERLVNPDAVATVALYLASLKAPGSPFLPSTWTLKALWPLLIGQKTGVLFYLGLSVTGALSVIFVETKLARVLYFKGVSKAQVARRWRRTRSRDLKGGWTKILPVSGKVAGLLSKDVKSFFRDNTQWSQLFLLGALMVVYLYNFKVLPIEDAPIEAFYLQNILSFLNMGLAGLVLSAVAVRFVFPAVSAEGQAIWLIRSAPIKLKTFLWVKFFTCFWPLLLLSETLVVLSNMFLSVTDFMMGLSTITIFLMVFGITSMGIGLGAAYPNFRVENIAELSTSFGGVLFMILCVAFIGSVIVLEAGPVYTVFMAKARGHPLSLIQWVWIGGSFVLVVVLNALAVFWPMRLGAERLARMDT